MYSRDFYIIDQKHIIYMPNVVHIVVLEDGLNIYYNTSVSAIFIKIDNSQEIFNELVLWIKDLPFND